MTQDQPYRAEHIGSLLRPAELIAARDAFKAGKLPHEELRALEDRSIRDVVAMQEDLGLRSITDGEFRRDSYLGDFVLALDGTELGPENETQLYYTDPKTGMRGIPGRKTLVTKPIRLPEGGITIEAFRFLKSVAKTGEPKVCIPGPPGLHYTIGRAQISRDVYPALDAFWDDVAEAYRQELTLLAAAGCTLVQIDETSIPKLGDPNIQANMAKRGDDWRELLSSYTTIMERVVQSAPDGMTVALHHCRGNNKGMWQADTSYEPTADALFRGINAACYFLEYDTPRAGDFSPLRHLGPEPRVSLGLVSTKERALEDPDTLKRRIDEAAKFVPLERLSLSPQCGFSPGYTGHPLTHDDQKRKLDLVVRVARDVWGTA
ncbi:MAG TPA: 5-methyltetrahydropteroyltriglutamate--homocysteine S-methyltransferase [Stellaceae bacterium]|nr:5-methyltetrahydropteroyltriglutamate--homocysteine S-methyltransferase [Stellaceae bacterium]